MSTARNASMAAHPAGKLGRRPGVRMVELRPAIVEALFNPLAAGAVDGMVRHEIAPAVNVLECLSCGALLAIGSPNAAHHVETHRGPRWRRALRDARIWARYTWTTWRTR